MYISARLNCFKLYFPYRKPDLHTEFIIICVKIPTFPVGNRIFIPFITVWYFHFVTVCIANGFSASGIPCCHP